MSKKNREEKDSGTIRVDNVNNDEEAGTVRMDSDDSTQRVSMDSTQRMSVGQGQSDSGTVRLDQEELNQNAITDEGSRKTGNLFANGHVIEINGGKYVVDSVISCNTGEGNIYKVIKDRKTFVLKHYKENFKPPVNVLEKIKSNPANNVIKVFEFGNFSGQWFEIMEYAEGGTLNEYIKETGAINDIAKLKDIIKQIAEGLDHLHKKVKIIYQDLKPLNIYFRDKERKNLILADFGISNIITGADNLVEVSASATTIYAAPDLACVAGQTSVIVGPAVDYYALGITMLQLWLGKKPFSGMSDAQYSQKIRYKNVDFPEDMDSNYKELIKGFIDPDPISRWGAAHIKKWIAGESLQSNYKKTTLKYETMHYNDKESYSNPEELADLLEKDPDRGITYLYKGVIAKWLEDAGDHYNLVRINDILAAVTDEKDKRTALFASVYALNPRKPFISCSKISCETLPQIADALMADAEYYMKALQNKKNFFYLFLIATEGQNGMIIADLYHKYFVDYSPKRALNLIFLQLQEDNGKSIKIGSKIYQSPDEIAGETDSGQIALIKKAVQEKDSLFLVWLSANFGDYFGSTDEFKALPAADKLFLLGQLPFLSYKELISNWQTESISDLIKLINSNPGREDLFAIYSKQGLPINGQMQELDWKPTPICYLVKFFRTIIKDEKTGFDLLRTLIKNGADINENAGDGTLPLVNAIRQRDIALTKMLLDLGADPDKSSKNGITPIIRAISRITGMSHEEDDKIVRIKLADLLLNYKVKLNIVDDGDVPLVSVNYMEGCQELYDLVVRMVGAGADVNLRDNDNHTSLTGACCYYVQSVQDGKPKEQTDYFFKIIEFLIKKGAKVNILSENNCWSPLMFAAGYNSVELAELLLKNGAKRDFPDKDGNTAFVYAKQNNYNDIAQLVSPAATLKSKNKLISAAKAAMIVVIIFNVFFTMDVVSRIMLSSNFLYPVMLGSSILLSYLLTSYILIVIFGINEFWEIIKGSFNFISSSLFVIFGIPICFPIAVGLLQFLTRFLPDGLMAFFNFPATLLTKPSSGIVILILYILFLGIMMAAKIILTRLLDKTGKAARIFWQYSDD